MEQKPKILIVDDKVENLVALETILEGEPLEVVKAESGNDALALTLSNEFALAILDVQMPVMTGYELAELMRGQAEMKNLPIIFVSAVYSDLTHIFRGYESGAVDFITKPYNANILISKIRVFVALYQQKKELEREIRNRRRAEEELLEKNNLLVEETKRADLAAEESKELLHILCHDLRTPVINILGFVQLIKETSEPTRKYIQIITKSAKQSMDLMDLVLKMRSLDQYELELEPLDLNEALLESQRQLQYRLQEKEIRLEIAIQPSTLVLAERTSLVSSVINNLLTNAIKFSYHNSKILVYAKKSEDRIVLSVQDQGIGISEKMQKNIFNPRIKTSRIGTDQEKGTGFGMPLVKKFMKAYGGTITVESQSEAPSSDRHGTIVHLTFKADT